MTVALDKKQQEAILTPGVRRLLKALNVAGEARVVGGAVRDVMSGKTLGDIDLATNLPPEKVIYILTREGIKVVPTGLAHGTVTAVVDHIGYEITTLRCDIDTDGRHAKVAFTDDWRLDAERRDFTFNAMYVDAEGHLSDYFKGAEDAQKGRVRFIGDARARIREDVLRILRFFRLYAVFGREEPDSEALAACRELAELIPQLSAERMAREGLKLLAAKSPIKAWRLMSESGVTYYFLPEAINMTRLQKLLDNETKYNGSASGFVRLAALLPEKEQIVSAVASRLKLSNKDRAKLCALSKIPLLLPDSFTVPAIRRLLYIHGADDVRDAVFLNGKNVPENLAVVKEWESPVFPIKGEDIVKQGIEEGPRVGEVLKRVEEWWIDGDFRATREACLAFAIEKTKN